MRFIAILQMLCLGVVAHAAEVKTTTTTPQKVTICLPQFREEFLSLSLLEAKDRGIFAKHGLDVDFKVIDGKNANAEKRESKNPRNVPSLMDDHGVAQTLASTPETCTVGTSTVERFFYKNEAVLADTQPLLITSYGKDYDTQLIVSAKSKIKTVADLKGKKVRLGQAPTYLAMDKLLKDEGLALDDIRFDSNTNSIDVLAKLESGELQAAITYVPTMPYMLASGKVRVLKANVVQSNVAAEIPHSLLVANRKFAQAQPEMMKALVASVQEANEYFARNPSDVMYTYQRHVEQLNSRKWNISKVTAEKAGTLVGKVNVVDLYNDADAKNRQATLTELNNYLALLIKGDFLTQKVNFAPWLGLPTTEQASIN